MLVVDREMPEEGAQIGGSPVCWVDEYLVDHLRACDLRSKDLILEGF